MASPDICSPNKGLIVALLEVINRFVKTINDVKDRVTLLEENYAALVEQERYKEEKGLDMLLKTSKDLKSAQERISDLEERFQPKPDESVESEDSKDLKFLPEHSLKVSNSDVVCKKLNKSKKTRTRPSKRAAFSTESSFENFASGEFETSSSTDASNGFSSQAPISHDAVVLEGHEIQPQLNSVEFSKAAESENSQINAVISICSSTSDPEPLPNVSTQNEHLQSNMVHFRSYPPPYPACNPCLSKNHKPSLR
ncbi:hypothetical protein L596_009549 [Steinernema carpocapsae]|uniref:Uncharacterized protein n=1 Tax=Steinernema carpocapsae TaxID=34508 RepID=A0A4U5PFZ1_STECR|nr:hypothetical protein L596_009549 [Steinernema carpocapsae]